MRSDRCRGATKVESAGTPRMKMPPNVALQYRRTSK
jgi:hypothetical protein